jgi:hypothetical protein
VGLHQKLSQSLVNTNFILSILGKIHFPHSETFHTVFTSVKNCSGRIHFCTELLTLLHSILYSLVTLHSCYVQNFLQNVLHCTECFKLLHLLLQRTSYTVCMHVQNSLHYIHFSKRITWLYSFTCRTFYNAITLVQNTLQLQSYTDAYKSNASRNSQLDGMCKELFCSQHL